MSQRNKRKGKRNKKGGNGGGGSKQPAAPPKPLPLGAAREGAIDVYGAHTAAKGRAVRAWCSAEVAAGSSCGCFAWRIEKCHKVRTAPAWEEGAELSECELDLSLPGLRREGKPFEVLVQGALASPDGATEFARECAPRAPPLPLLSRGVCGAERVRRLSTG